MGSASGSSQKGAAVGVAGGGSSCLVQNDCILSAMSISAIVNVSPVVFDGTVRFSAGGAPLPRGFRILPLSTLPDGHSHCPGHFAEHTTTEDQMRVSQERKYVSRPAAACASRRGGHALDAASRRSCTYHFDTETPRIIKQNPHQNPAFLIQ